MANQIFDVLERGSELLEGSRLLGVGLVVTTVGHGDFCSGWFGLCVAHPVTPFPAHGHGDGTVILFRVLTRGSVTGVASSSAPLQRE